MNVMFSPPVRERHPSEPAYPKVRLARRITANSHPKPQIIEKLTLSDVMGMQMRLYYDSVEIKENIMRLQDEIKTMRELLESRLDVQDEPDNYDMSVEDIKKLIVKECTLGQQYYPGDLAFEYGLNYNAVLEAVASLKEEGRVQH